MKRQCDIASYFLPPPAVARREYERGSSSSPTLVMSEFDSHSDSDSVGEPETSDETIIESEPSTSVQSTTE